MKRTGFVVLAAVLLVAGAALPATAYADDVPVIDDQSVTQTADQTATQTAEQTTEQTTTDESPAPESSTEEATSDTSDAADKSADSSEEPCTTDCDSTPPCTENCGETPACTVDCGGTPACVVDCVDTPCIDCIPVDDPCIDDLNACGDDLPVAGEGIGPTAVAGTGALPFTGIEDVLLPLLVGALALVGGVVAYRQANVSEALASAREYARRLRAERERTGYTYALRNIDAEREAHAWVDRTSVA